MNLIMLCISVLVSAFREVAIIYKILLDNYVIDVIDTMRYVMYQACNDLVLLSDRAEAFGILSSDSSTIWHVEGLKEPPSGREFATVQAVEISTEEGEKLRAELNGEITEPEEGTDPEPQPEPVLSPTEMLLQIKQLSQEVGAMKEKNDMLEACILEMSEQVYA